MAGQLGPSVGLIGVGIVGALLLSDKPLGCVAILGVLALRGMIARNSVILIDHEKDQRAAPARQPQRGS